jgi:hypothetical protein
MRKPYQLALFLCFIVAITSCNSSSKRESLNKSGSQTYDEILPPAPLAGDSTAPMSSSAAVVNKKDSVHKFVRTADIKFKVKDVVKATYAIEDITTKSGGFVTLSDLKSDVQYSNEAAVSDDSTLESTYYMVTNTMTIRVPVTKLDTVLRSIGKLVDFMDYRTIKADDASMQLLANKMLQKRTEQGEQRIAKDIDRHGKKLGETVNAEESALSKQEERDNAKLANMMLNDQINYSTVTLALYQNKNVRRELVPNDKSIRAYEPGFGRKLVEELQTGWHALEAVILFLVGLWGPILLIVIAIWGFLKIKNMRWERKAIVKED